MWEYKTYIIWLNLTDVTDGETITINTDKIVSIKEIKEPNAASTRISCDNGDIYYVKESKKTILKAMKVGNESK